MMHKIQIKQKEEITSIVERMLDIEDDSVLIEVPKKSQFGKSLLNFQLLKREADSAGKVLYLISENEEVLQMARDTGYARPGEEGEEAVHEGSSTVSDILPPSAPTDLRSAAKKRDDEGPEVDQGESESRAVNIAHEEDDHEIEDDDTYEDEESDEVLDTTNEEDEEDEEDEEKEPEAEDVSFPVFHSGAESTRRDVIDLGSDDDSDLMRDKAIKSIFDRSSGDRVTAGARPQKRSAKRIFVFIVAALLFAGLAYVAVAVLPRARVELSMKKFQWEYNDAVIANSAIAEPQASGFSVPMEIATLSKNVDLTVPVSGKREVANKAEGTIRIYNAYSSEPQTLVATTRFLTPDGKLYRLNKTTRVPAARIVDGKIDPQYVEAAVTADKPGEEFNVGPVERFSIPGFKGSPKYDGFYGTSIEAMEGGYIGEVSVVTQADIDEARAKAQQAMESSLDIELEEKVPEDFMTIEGMEDIEFSELQFSHDIGDTSDELSVSAEIIARTGFFREQDILDMFTALARDELEFDAVLVDYSIQYGVARTDFEEGEASLPVQYAARYRRSVDIEQLRNDFLGKNETEAKSVIFALPGIESVSISYWPIWVQSFPNDLNRISITVE